MEMIAVLIGLLVFGVPIWLIVRAVSTRNRIEELSRRLNDLELEFIRRKRDASPAPAAKVATEPIPTAQPVMATPLPVAQSKPEPKVVATQTPPAPTPTIAAPLRPTEPKFIPPVPPLRPLTSPPPARPKINWEQFMGVKGFAWLGGLALFLGVAFFIKYSFDNNLIPPQLRVAIGFLTGLGLLVGGVVMSRKNFPALSQTLCATGVVILYAVTFACRALYHFEFFGPIPTFLLMSLITTAAFLLAARLNALVVAILGMLGGFLTPVLLSTGQDNPLGLFGYIAILDLGLIVVARAAGT